MLPRIGITGSVAPSRIGTRRTFLNEPYLIGVRDAGGLPLVVTPAHQGESLRALYDWLDGLLLTGGEDVEPARYGETVRHASVESVPERDALELQLLEWARADGLPVFAICRGIQVLNVALGGTLYQDIREEWPEAVRHDYFSAEYGFSRDHLSHEVYVERGSLLHDLFDSGQLLVNSMHHQGVRRLAPGVRPTAFARSGE